jgi:Concanavalin A-like lectin/glucanases superfamily
VRNDRAQGVATLVNGTWQQVTVTYDGTLPPAERVNIYVDGVHDVTLPESSSTLTAYGSDLSIGCLPELPATTTQIGLVGRIDDAVVWTRAFTATEVLAWYTATL